jgi:hypothetical protein
MPKREKQRNNKQKKETYKRHKGRRSSPLAGEEKREGIEE